MSNNAVCLDTSIWIKYLCPDEQEEAATRLESLIQETNEIIAIITTIILNTKNDS